MKPDRASLLHCLRPLSLVPVLSPSDTNSSTHRVGGNREIIIEKQIIREKSGIFRQTAKFGHRPCLLHISNIGIKNKVTKQKVKS